MFIDQWVNGLRMVEVLVKVLYVFIFMMILALGFIIWDQLKAKPVYVISSQGAFSAKVQEYPLEVVGILAQMWVLSWTNYTPSTIEYNYQRLSTMMTPAFLARQRVKQIDDIGKVKKGNISSVFNMAQEPLIERAKNGYKVLIRGESKYFINDALVTNRQITYELRINKTSAHEANPWGLLIDGLDLIQEVRT
jgi:hypothetical protein